MAQISRGLKFEQTENLSIFLYFKITHHPNENESKIENINEVNKTNDFTCTIQSCPARHYEENLQ